MKKILCLLAMLLSLQVFARTYSKETNEESTIKISLENCWWDSDEYVTCDKDGEWLGCPCGSHEW